MILDGLNDAQLEAVTAGDGPLLVLAGPGSGKTRVLTRRVAYLVQERQIPPWKLMAVTFTNRAAKEIRHRVEGIIDVDLEGLTMGTFHSLCARILRREAVHLNISSNYLIFDAADQLALMKEVVSTDLHLDPKKYSPNRFLSIVSNAKNNLITAEDYRAESYFEEIAVRAYQRYQERLLMSDAVDFDDLLMMTAVLLRDNDIVRAKYQGKYAYVLVDEFQDTNTAQYNLVQLLAAPQNNLFCVGDEDQSIYRWRGADYRNVNRLRSDYPDLTTILLEQNYRSTQTILNAAVAVIDRNPNRTAKKLFTEGEEGPQLMLHEAHNEHAEAQFIVEQIASLVAQGEADPGDVAVMYRTNAQSRLLEEAFVKAGLPYRLVGGTRFYSRREIKDLLAYLRLVHNPEDQVSMNRVINTPSRGIGKKTLETLEQWRNAASLTPYQALLVVRNEPERTPFSSRAGNALRGFIEMLEGWRDIESETNLGDLLKVIVDETEYYDYITDGTEQGLERWENVEELLSLTAEFEDIPLATFLEEVSLVADIDSLPQEVNAPTLMTLHSAKGLEFDVVFLTGLEEGVLPHSRSKDDPEEMAEERRLMYVGMTRARKQLYLVYAFKRTTWGESVLNTPSRFLEDIPDELMLTPGRGYSQAGYRRMTSWQSTTTPPKPKAETPTIEVGQRVSHPTFGEGVVMSSVARGSDVEVSIVFEEVGPKRLMASFANLTMLEG